MRISSTRVPAIALGLAALFFTSAAGQSTCCQPPPPPQPLERAAYLLVNRAAPSCAGDADCRDIEAPKIACADRDTATCDPTTKTCHFQRRQDAACACIEGELRWCPATGKKNAVQFCVRGGPAAAAWQHDASGAVCGPSRIACDPRRRECSGGTVSTVFDEAGARWVADPDERCAPDPSCPPDGAQRTCTPADPLCSGGVSSYDPTAGWSECRARYCPPCRPGQSEGCELAGCGGRRTCDGSGHWGDCHAPARCPAGWRDEGATCAWVSPHEGSSFMYYPHRVSDRTMAATAPIGTPTVDGQPVPLYVEATLAQWSNPPAGGGGNHCGKDNHPSAWVGCVHPDGARGYGRDVLDREWQSGAMIPLRCDPGDTVGSYKNSWGFNAGWHCSRQVSLSVVRNHDAVAVCTP
jgi:hypothetical protein